MKLKSAGLSLAALLTAVGFAGIALADLPAETPLDRYVRQPDASYSWKVVNEGSADGMKLVVVEMVSQTWRTSADVNRTEWHHWLAFAIPPEVRSDTAL